MCDRIKHAKKLEPKVPPPAGTKILKRIKLEDKKKIIAEEAIKQIPTPIELHPISNEIVEEHEENEEEDSDEELNQLEAFDHREHDRLVEEILTKRKLSRAQQSGDNSTGVEDEILEEHSQLLGEVTDRGDGSHLFKSYDQIEDHSSPSITSIMKDRILFHGLNKYTEHYQGAARSRLYSPEKKRYEELEGSHTHSSSRITPVFKSDTASTGDSLTSSNLNYDLDSRAFKRGTAQIVYSGDEAEGDALLDDDNDTEDPLEQDKIILEQLICLESRKKKRTMKEEYVPYKTIPGYPKCVDNTSGYPECLPPGEIVRLAIKPDQLWGFPINRPLSKEQVIGLLNRMESYPTNDYMYLTNVNSATRVFNPYQFKIVPFKDADPKNYFTLSKSGIMHFQNGYSEHTSIVNFIKEIHIYEQLRQMPFFTLFPVFKTFRVWKSNIAQTRMKKNRKQLEELLFTTKRPLRGMLLLFSTIKSRVREMGLLNIQPKRFYEIKDFVAAQQERLILVLQRLDAFEKTTTHMTENACRTHLIESGFTCENYAEEVAFHMKTLTIPVEKLPEETVAAYLDYPGQWLPYSLQAKKRRVCQRLSNFVHLVDFYVQAAYYEMFKTSVMQFMCELHQRTRQIPRKFRLGGTPKYTSNFLALRKRNEAMLHKFIVGNKPPPVFELECYYSQEAMAILPTFDSLMKQIRAIFSVWRNGISSYRNLLPGEVFNPYTSPVVNGHMDQKTCGEGPSWDNLCSTDPDLNEVYETIEQIIAYGFDACKQYIEVFTTIRKFCEDNDNFDALSFQTEENVEVLGDLMEKYYEQMKQVKNTDDGYEVGIFYVNNHIIQENAGSSVQRIIDHLHNHILSLARKCVKDLKSRIQEANDNLDSHHNLLTIEDFAEHILYLDHLGVLTEDLHSRLDNSIDIVELIELYAIPESENEIQAINSLLQLMGQLHDHMEIRRSSREALVTHLSEELHTFDSRLLLALNEVRLRTDGLEGGESQYVPVDALHILDRSRELLLNYQVRASKYKQYREQLGLEPNVIYEQLYGLLSHLDYLHRFWKTAFQNQEYPGEDGEGNTDQPFIGEAADDRGESGDGLRR